MNHTFPLTKEWEVCLTNETNYTTRPTVYMVHKPCGNFDTLYAILEEGPKLSMRYNVECRLCHKLFPDHSYLTPKILTFMDLFTILELNI